MSGRYLLTLAALSFLSLATCGDDDDAMEQASQNNMTAATQAQQIAQLEDNGSIPKLDRSPSLAGPDADGNGVRDDIDRYIAQRPISEPQKASLTQLARGFQQAVLTDATQVETANDVANRVNAGIGCVYRRFPGQPSQAATLVEEMEAITANTIDRLRAYLRYNHALDGTVSAVSRGDTCA